MLKTIYLPNEQINAINVENDNLKRWIEEERQASEEQIATLQEEIKLREEELIRRRDLDYDKLQELVQKNNQLEKYKSELAKGLLIL